MIKINFYVNKFQGLIEILKKNYLLAIVYPIVILFHLYFLNLYKDNNFLDLFVIISLSNQFDIGLFKNTFFQNKKYNLIIVVMIIMICLILLTFISSGILLLFELNFKLKYLFIVFIGLLANEFKSYFDSRSNYTLGFTIKNILNFSVIFIFFYNITPSLISELIVISLIAFSYFILLYLRLEINIKNSINYSDFKFFFINIFSFISGNVDRFLVIPFIGYPLRDSYLYYTETNTKLYGLFGFLNNLFLYKQIRFSLFLIFIIGLLLLISVFSIYFYFDIDYNYLLFSFSLIISVFSQYYIYSKIGDLKGLSISFFPVIGTSIYLVLFYFINKFLTINLLTLTFILISKSLSELVFIYILNRVKINFFK